MKLFVFALLAVAVAAEEYRAVVYLQGGPDKYVTGNVTFTQVNDGPVQLVGRVVGLSPGNHGFHVHDKGDLSGGCASTGGHFNPYNVAHGAPTDKVRHVGDLGNIYANSQGIANIAITDDMITLCNGPNSIVGRAVVVHSGEDDLGKGGQTDSLTTGHAGARAACGVIGIQSTLGNCKSKNSASSAAASVFVTLCATSLLLRI